MATRGHPRAKIDWDRVDELARAHCSMTAIAKILKYNYHTLSRAIERDFRIRATDYLHERKEEGTGLMREAIYQAGIKGNIIAQIFWLKNRDGWSDKAVIQHEMLPPVQISLPADVSQQDVKMIEEFFNAQTDDNKRIRKEPEGLQERKEADN